MAVGALQDQLAAAMANHQYDMVAKLLDSAELEVGWKGLIVWAVAAQPAFPLPLAALWLMRHLSRLDVGALHQAVAQPGCAGR
jgi:hypothetical protein